MSNASKTLYRLLPLVISMALQSVSFAQTGGGSVRDTTFTFYSLNTCVGVGSVPTDFCDYLAVVKKYAAPSGNNTDKHSYNVNSEVTYYKITCKSCGVLRWRSPGKVEVSLPASSKVHEPKLLDQLHTLLQQQVLQACDGVKSK